MGEEVPYVEKLRSLHFSRPRDRKPKVSVDDHSRDQKVQVTEHWNDRVDVHVKNPEVTVNPSLRAQKEKA